MTRDLCLFAALLLTAGLTAPAAEHADRKLDVSLLARAHAPAGTSRVIVRTADPDLAVRHIRDAGGTFRRQLPAANSVAADVPDRALDALATRPEILAISVDRPVTGAADAAAATVGTRWVQESLGVDGSGVGVATIDSGIAASHDDLLPQRIAVFADFVNALTSPYDDYGHGTHVAGIIAGNGYDSGGSRRGVAPGVNLVVLKALDANGGGYISNVISAVDYAIANRQAYNIRVINLSVAAGVYESYNTDPLTLAARRAVDAGIVVVAAAGNFGMSAQGTPQYSGITAPGNAPWVLTVGASNDMGTSDRDDDIVAPFSSRGPSAVDGAEKPDLVAPGVNLASTTDPGSALYAMHPNARIWGSVRTASQPYLSLSGTSMAAPVVTGTVALMLQVNPALSPADVKAILRSTARSSDKFDASTQGAGFLDARAAVELARRVAVDPDARLDDATDRNVTICTDDPSNCGGSSAFAALDREPQAEGASQRVAGAVLDESFDDLDAAEHAAECTAMGALKDLPVAARVYVGSIIAAGLVMFAIGFPFRTFDSPVLLLTLMVLSSVTSVYKVHLPLVRSGSTMSVSYAVDFASLLLLGRGPTMLVAVASAYSQCTFRIKERNPLYRTLFSMACLVLTVQTAGIVYGLLGGVPGVLTLNSVARPLVGAATTYFIINTLTVATAIALSTRQSIAKIWNENFLWSAPSYFVGASAAALGAWIVVEFSGKWLAPLAAAPLYLTYRTYKVYLGRIEDERRHVNEMAELHLATIEALALAIDAKDQTSQTHIRRVQLYATSVARSMGMAENEVQGVKTAALLHDIGKLAVPEHILSKPGPLTPEEFQKIRAHPKVGADIVSSVPFPYPVAPLILSHHERWDGKGYPSGLKGTQIPLGARILSAVDYFDALMADRPYHKAMSYDAAIGLLRQEAGKGLDPAVVATFIEQLPSLQAQAAKLESALKRSAQDPAGQPVGRPATGLMPEPAKKNVFEDIALAHREIYALYEIAQAMGTSLGVSDTMALITAKLSNLVPYSCAALFLYDEEADALRCRFATGTDAELINQISVRSGEGLTGWVARNRRPLVNARPSADFEAAGLLSMPSTLQSALVCPLLFNDRFIGTLSVYHVEPAFYRDDHRRLLDRVSEQAAAVINNSVLFEQTQEDSLTDPLTGLPNTRFLFMHLTRELARADRLDSEVALMVMDLDCFKEINDNHGHHVGDRALCEVARVLRAAIRPYDICVRYAGDEFIVVLSGCSMEEAEQKRVELQQSIDEVYFEARPGKRLKLGISLGTAVFPHDGNTYEALLAVADNRMYQDKAARKRSTARVALEASIRADV